MKYTEQERRARRLRHAELATETVDTRSPALRSLDPASFRAEVNAIMAQLAEEDE